MSTPTNTEPVDVPFLFKKVTSKLLKDIAQIDYEIAPYKGSPTPDLISVYASNNLTDEPAYPWTTMSSSYAIYLKRAFYRLELLKLVSLWIDIDKDHRLSVQQHLVHMDKTLDAIWAEADDTVKEKKLNGSWRSQIFDRWLAVEFELQRHVLFWWFAGHSAPGAAGGTWCLVGSWKTGGVVLGRHTHLHAYETAWRTLMEARG
jgi:hypothetical protein